MNAEDNYEDEPFKNQKYKPLSFKMNKSLKELIARYEEMQTSFYTKPYYKKLMIKLWLRLVLNHIQ